MPSSQLSFVCLLALATVACERSGNRVAAPVAQAPEAGAPLDWVLVYYFSYDNDLDWAAAPILTGLANGLHSDRIAVIGLLDGQDDGGMSRIVMGPGQRTRERLETEDSASIDVLRRQLAWVAEHFRARRYGIVFLDHGGRLAELGYDQRPSTPEGPSWLQVPDVARTLNEWRAQLPGELALLFLQQCGKGSVENVFELRSTARALVVSEVLVGAPNGYYDGALRALSKNPEMDGFALARAIATNEPAPMFGTYSVIDAVELGELPARLDAALAPLLAEGLGLRGAGWDLRREWLDLGDEGGGLVDIEIRAPGRYQVATLSTVPAHMTIRRFGGPDVDIDSQWRAVGSVVRDVELAPGRYRVRLTAAQRGGDGQTLLRLIPGPAIGPVYDAGGGETFVDLIGWLDALYLSNQLSTEPVRELERWIADRLIVGRRVSPAFADEVAASGLSLLLAEPVERLGDYADYDLYEQTQLDELHQALQGEVALDALTPGSARLRSGPR